jgi:hypothetical protein
MSDKLLSEATRGRHASSKVKAAARRKALRRASSAYVKKSKK